MPPSTDMVESTFHFLRLARKTTDVDAGFYVRGSKHFVDEKSKVPISFIAEKLLNVVIL
jgi:hypothetical protein